MARKFLVITLCLLIFFIKTTVISAQTCTNTFTPVASPIVDMGNSNYTYYPDRENPQNGSRNYTGGLYGNGSNLMPTARMTQLINVANSVSPLNASGQLDLANGKIGFISIGMSNTRMGFGPFLEEANDTPAVNPKIKIVNTAISSADAPTWDQPTDVSWSIALQNIASNGLTPQQVQVVWLKQAIMGPQNETDHIESLANYLANISRTAKQLLPNLKIIYFSSRTRSYDVNTLATHQHGLNSEPYAYESAFAVRQVILEQINNPNGRLNLNEAPFLTWGPYIWADGENQRSDGLVWLASNLNQDCTHPSGTGTAKVGSQLMNFFMTDVSTGWFLGNSGTSLGLSVAASQNSGRAPLQVNFTAQTASDTVFWNFSDGTTARGNSVVKTFFSNGNYTAWATAINTSGQSNKKSISIVVQPAGVTNTPTNSVTPTGNLMPGDANGDGRVDTADYIIWLNHYGTNTPNGHIDGDFNISGVVEGVDYIIWLNNY